MADRKRPDLFALAEAPELGLEGVDTRVEPGRSLRARVQVIGRKTVGRTVRAVREVSGVPLTAVVAVAVEVKVRAVRMQG